MFNIYTEPYSKVMYIIEQEFKHILALWYNNEYVSYHLQCISYFIKFSQHEHFTYLSPLTISMYVISQLENLHNQETKQFLGFIFAWKLRSCKVVKVYILVNWKHNYSTLLCSTIYFTSWSCTAYIIHRSCTQ